MNRNLLLLSTAIAAATSAQATTYWSVDWATTVFTQDFNTDYETQATANTPDAVSNGLDEWRHTGGKPRADQLDGQGGLWLNSDGQSRGASYVLDSSFFDGAGTYYLNYQVWALYNNTTGNVQIYEALAGDGEENVYNINNAGPPSTGLGVTASGTATITLLARITHQRDISGGDVTNAQLNSFSLPFNYTGGDKDVILHFWASNPDQSGTIGNSLGFTFGGNLSIDDQEVTVVTWAGYPVEDGYVDTGDFLGWLFVGDGSLDDWVFAYDLGAYIHLPEENVNPDAGTWFFAPRD